MIIAVCDPKGIAIEAIKTILYHDKGLSDRISRIYEFWNMEQLLDASRDRMLYNEINAQANRKVCVMLLQHFVNFIGGNEEICVFDDGKLISRGKHDKLYDRCGMDERQLGSKLPRSNN